MGCCGDRAGEIQRYGTEQLYEKTIEESNQNHYDFAQADRVADLLEALPSNM